MSCKRKSAEQSVSNDKVKFPVIVDTSDFKTSKRIKKKDKIHSYFAQGAAYSIMWEERTGMSIPNVVIVMDVDHEKPLVFVEHRDNWTKLLKDTINEYRTRKMFGH